MVRSPASSRTTKPVPPFQTSPGTALVAGGRRARKADATSSTDAFMVTRLHKVRLPGQAPSRRASKLCWIGGPIWKLLFGKGRKMRWEEGRGGKEGVSMCRFRGALNN